MSHIDFPCTSAHYLENTCAQDSVKNSESTEDSRDESADKDTKQMSRECSSPDTSVRERVLKEVGFTSTTFIGPAFPPPVKPDIEDTLSEFYKELEKIDSADGANENQEKNTETPGTCNDEQNQNMSRLSDTRSYQKGSGQKQQTWPHWYQNEPYLPQRPRPKLSMDLISGGTVATQNQRHQPPPFNRPPNPRPHRPPYHHRPPSAAFLNPEYQLPHTHPRWNHPHPGLANQCQEESHFDPNWRFPQSNECNYPSQGFYGNSPYDYEKKEWGCNHETLPNNANVEWSRDAEEEWSHLSEDRDWRLRSETEHELWEQHDHCQPPNNTYACRSSLVLILMRGLPGSGKSTLAKELLSTGPNGLILSTDDYFAHRDGYCYDPSLIGAAHEWNQSRAREAMRDGCSPIIIDNTNIQAWEMKPYVKMALERGYKVDFREPDTSWKFDPFELEKRNKHGVPQEKIAHMLDRFSFPISIDIVMRSQEPPHVNMRHRPEQQHVESKNRDFHSF